MVMSRREFLAGCAAATSFAPWNRAARGRAEDRPTAVASPLQLGLVTYNWGRDWDIETLIRNCEETGFGGVELRSTHKHGVEITLDRKQRRQVQAVFAASNVELVGLGSACEYHSADPAIVRKNIEETKSFVELCHDVGGTGVKVRPNGFVKGVPPQKTLEQIGRSLNEVAEYGVRFGVQIRLEVHGRGTAELPHIRSILDVADHPNTVVCWNCNPTDLNGEGLEHNFQLVADRIGIVHIHDLRNEAYPWKQFFDLLKKSKFSGWTLLEEGRVPDDVPAAMKENLEIWNRLVT